MVQVNALKSIKTLFQFDDFYTAPIHGFRDAREYYSRCSAINFLKPISVPTLIINARNDPFLSSDCFPGPEDVDNEKIELCYPEKGGHVGFMMSGSGKDYFHEKKALEFVQSYNN